MGPTDFGLSILASMIANYFGKPEEEPPSDLRQPEIEIGTTAPSDVNVDSRSPARFRTFDVLHDLQRLAEMIEEPVIHILIEDKPSTAYRLPSLVLECRQKGEWYVFSRGRMSFEGTHGGWKNSVGVIAFLREMQIPIAAWIVDTSELVALDDGQLMWLEIKPRLVPLVAAPSNEFDWKTIQKNAQDLLA